MISRLVTVFGILHLLSGKAGETGRAVWTYTKGETRVPEGRDGVHGTRYHRHGGWVVRRRFSACTGARNCWQLCENTTTVLLLLITNSRIPTELIWLQVYSPRFELWLWPSAVNAAYCRPVCEVICVPCVILKQCPPSTVHCRSWPHCFNPFNANCSKLLLFEGSNAILV